MLDGPEFARLTKAMLIGLGVTVLLLGAGLGMIAIAVFGR